MQKIKNLIHKNDTNNTAVNNNQTGNVLPPSHRNPLDKNGDGRVDLNDLSARNNALAPGVMQTQTTTTSQTHLGQQGMNPLDRNHDGRVDARDFAGQPGYGQQGMNPLDRNHDGRVDARDFTGQPGLAGAHHNPLDRNFDGKVDINDLSGQRRLSQTYETSYVQSAQRSSITAQPTLIETIQKDIVVHEHIHPVEKEEIQPIIYREREQLDVKQVTQMMHETQIQPTIVQQRELPAERREAIIERGAAIQENIILPTTTRDATLRTEVVHAPIVNEIIKKTVIEEVQPVLERDVFVPTIVQNTQPIYEKIVEAPVVYREVRDMRTTEYVQPVLAQQTYVQPMYVEPAREVFVERAAPIVAAPLAPRVEYVTMATTTTTNETFVPAKLVQEGELRNWQPSAASVGAAPLNSKRM